MSDSQIRLWSAGDYPSVARQLRPIAVETVDAARVERGDRVLDVATGDGNAAIECARRGASVVGIDLTPKQIALANERCVAEGVEVDLRVGDAMALGVDDDAFDVVLSVLGVMFAPDPDVDVAVDFFSSASPPHVTALAKAAEVGMADELRRRFRAIVEEANEASDGSCSLPAPWLLAVAAPSTP